jgi:predicted Zn-dependent protease
MASAIYFDGQSSRRHVVTLTFGARVEIADAVGGDLLAVWPYDAIRRVDGPEDGLRLACTAAAPLARLELRDPAAQGEVLRRCSVLDGAGSAAPVSLWRIATASLAAAAAIVGMVWLGMPLLANRLAAVMPYSWEKPLGDAVDPRIRAIFGAACERPAGAAALKKLLGQLQTAAKLPSLEAPVVLRSTVQNAFAVPGGRVYVLSGLLATAQTPDELGGVLAHELGHVAQRDGLRRLIRDGGTSFLVGLMFGDITGSGVVLMAGRLVLSAAHTRAAEEGADAFAATVMHSLGRPTAPLGALLQRISGPERESAASLLRDHPLPAERKAMLERDDAPPSRPALLDEVEWRELKRICAR